MEPLSRAVVSLSPMVTINLRGGINTKALHILLVQFILQADVMSVPQAYQSQSSLHSLGKKNGLERAQIIATQQIFMSNIVIYLFTWEILI